eukprot:Phypoly_transcript_03206.p1 GENE.Phypoly_transcript_03206~~Phypoly_transcript_03206.p1  ORF type:complete len:546 (+),score=76.96 Phypoly_transcript_03206:855-2492(+)
MRLARRGYLTSSKASKYTPPSHNTLHITRASSFYSTPATITSGRAHERGAGGALFASVLVGGSLLLLLQKAHAEAKTEAADTTHTHNYTLPPDFVDELITLLGNRVDETLQVRTTHGKDNSYHTAPPPNAIVYPMTTEEVAAIVKLCGKYNVPIIPYGAGTSLEGHTIAPVGGITLDFSKMAKMICLHKEDMDVTVQPGMVHETLNEILKPHGLFFPLDPGPGASIGGMVGTSCSGTNAVRYGTMKELILSLTVVLPNGKIVKTRSRAKKSSAGYDLTHLYVGSEGTLGIVTEITIKVKQIPEKCAVALVTFPSIGQASTTVIHTIQKGISIGRAELLDDIMMKAVNLSSGSEYSEQHTLLFEFSGTAIEVEKQIEQVKEISKQNDCEQFRFAVKQDECETLWLARKVALWSSKALRPTADLWITDVCVPISRLADIINATKDDLKDSPLQAPLVSHAGDGNFHLFILFDPNDPKEMKEANRINENLIKRAIEMEGTCTGEHGVGLGKRHYLELELGREAVDLMKTIKRAIDPQNIMNPGKIIEL